MSERQILDTPLRGIELADPDGSVTGDRIVPWAHSGFGSRVVPRHGVDLFLSGRKIEVSVTRKRAKVHIWVDGVQWQPVDNQEGRDE